MWQKQSENSAVMSEQWCSYLKAVVLQLAAGMAWSSMTDERGRDSQKDEVLASAVAASTDKSRMVITAGQEI